MQRSITVDSSITEMSIHSTMDNKKTRTQNASNWDVLTQEILLHRWWIQLKIVYSEVKITSNRLYFFETFLSVE